MSSGDLKNLLQDLATEGSTGVELDEQQLVPRIRTRRRRRAGLVAAVSASTAVMLAAGAFVVLPGGEREQPPVATPTVTATAGWINAFSCGGTFSAPLTGDPSLRFDVKPQEATRDAQGIAAMFALQMTNTTGKPLELFGTPNAPRVVVVKDGVVVAEPLGETLPGHHWKFGPGQTVTLQVAMAIRRCERTAVPGSTQLEPGNYQIYATKTFSHSGDGSSRTDVVVAGGPWTIQLK
ncbi:hypothetical protein [Kribbella catacumbae]|uniref:hypothetical protein n=1 Tax=Kribbella catacumbae TaxID=460086 RepID=UPI000367276B|nr:hypothetical protein [Kribbella catacumbae]